MVPRVEGPVSKRDGSFFFGKEHEEHETRTDLTQLKAIASRIREMREIMGWTREEMAEKTDVSPAEYEQYEAGTTDMPFTFILKSAQTFNMELTELLEGHNALLSSY